MGRVPSSVVPAHPTCCRIPGSGIDAASAATASRSVDLPARLHLYGILRPIRHGRRRTTHLGSEQPLTIVSCSRPDPLGLKLVANRADGLEVTVDAANGEGTLQFTKRPGQTEPGAKVPAKVSAGRDGTLLLDFEVNRAIVSCG